MTTWIRVGVLGAGGRMGRTVCSAVQADASLELVAAIDPHHAGEQIDGGLEIAADLDALVAARVQVVVDFTSHDAAMSNLEWCGEHGIHAVVGTTGFSVADLDKLAKLFDDTPQTPNCLIAPNFAIGAVLMMRFAEMAAPYFETAEVIEFHHDAKIDSPSGTATHTAARIAAASSDWAPDPTKTETSRGARGAEPSPGVHVHAVRMRGMVAHQEVIMGTTGQTITIRHDSIDRTSFMPGVVLAAKNVASRPGLTIGIDSLLF